MDQISEKVYKQLKQLTVEVKNDLRRKGVVVPVKNDDGTVSIGFYTVKKANGYYQVFDHTDDIIVDQINLPQSAIIIANNLALGKFVDKEILNSDRNYGYAAFEELLHKRFAEKNMPKNVDKADVYFTKSAVNKSKKDRYKADILRTFEKLKKFA